MRYLLIAFAWLVLSFVAQAQANGYGVFCANGRIEIDSRSADQMRSQRGACQFARFPFRMDAESFAKKNFGKVGAPREKRVLEGSFRVSAIARRT